jgi:ATP-binding cassette subfamily B protein
MKTLARLLRFLRPHKRLVALAFISLFGSTVLSLALPRILGTSIDEVVERGEFSYLAYAGLIVIGIALGRGLFAYFESYYREALSQRVAYDIRNALYDKLQRLSFAYHDKQQTGQLMSRATADVENVRWFVNMGVVRLVYLVLLVGAIAGILLSIDWALALMCLGFLPIVTVRGINISGKLRGIWNRAQERTGELGTIMQESMVGIKVVKAFHRAEYEEKKFAAKSQELSDENLLAVRVQASNTPLMNFLFTGLIGLILWYGGHQIIEGKLTPGDLTQFILYMAMLQMPVRITGFLINLVARAISSGDRIFEILDAKSPVEEKPGAVELKSVKGRVAFENVSFDYEATAPLLRDVSFEAAPGQVVALLGATGSGKTTLAQLLPRFYDVTGGRITIDSVDVRDATLESLRKTVGVVQQDVFLFSATVRDNIAYGAHEASQERVEWAAKIARLHDFIMSLPQGYDTWVGERGITLSGGQKQRVAIARTLLTDPRIIVLDDSTSSVDTKTEFEIREALNRLMEGRTTFVIAQRLSTVKHAGLIIVLKEGRILQRGTHESLLREGGLYRDIYELQLRPQEEAGEKSAAAEARP